MHTSNNINNITIVAPGRICLFGDHQDYLGLPVIACAINRQMILSAEINNDNYFHILMPNINSKRHISISETFNTLEPQDYFASTLRVVKRYGCIPTKGYTIILESNIPINAGVSSSSAIIVAWVHFLLKAFGCNKKISPQFIAQVAYEAEVLEHNAPGGKMDQYTIGIGNIIFLETGDHFSYKIIGDNLKGMILGESGIPKDTLGLLASIKSNALKAIQIIKEEVSSFNIETAAMKDFEDYSHFLSEELKPYFYAAIQNHIITQKALIELKKPTVDLKIIGKLMNEHHTVLRDDLKITIPEIDTMIDAALKAGAYGAKIVGSGGGGSIVVLSPSHKKEVIINAMLKSGAKAAYEVSVSQGVHCK